MNIFMNIKIRCGTFETNSSSVHSLVICKNELADLPDYIYFGLGEFGWEQREYYDEEAKAEYINTALWSRFCSYEEDYEKYYNYQKAITNILENYGITAHWKDVKGISKDKSYYYYVDHAYDVIPIIDTFLQKPDLLIKWLFSSKSILITDNDNSDMELTEAAREKYDENPDYEIYEKYN